MLEGWRWFGPDDPVTLEHVRHTGATEVVTALHGLNQGQVWTDEAVRERQAMVAAAGLRWSVVESIAVPETIKTRTGDFREAIERYKQSVRAVGRAGIGTICYNFMAITDWTRTDLAYRTATGALALRFDAVAFAAYDLFVLQRSGAADDYTPERIEAARHRLASMSEGDVAALERNLIEWLPARDVIYDRASFLRQLSIYRTIPTEEFRANLLDFVREIAPVAEEAGVRLAIHPDDPAFPLFGLPRVVSSADDLDALLAAVPSPANGVTFCTGSLGSNPANDVGAMARALGPRIFFAHLRNTAREADGSFHEAAHLDGDTDMIDVIAVLMKEEARREASGAADPIPMRPDHGHLMMTDIGTRTNPGYSGIGRLRGLAELRGVMRTLERKGADLRA